MTPQEERNADIESNTESDPPFLYDSLVTVLVGSQETRFELHRGLLCASSDFFRAAITGNFKERDQNEIKLPKQDVKIFKFFVHWLYTGRLRGFYYPATIKPSLQDLRKAVIVALDVQKRVALQDLDIDDPNGRALYMAHYRDAPFAQLVGLYILADTLLVHGLKDPIITLIVDVYRWNERTRVTKDKAGPKGTQQKGKGAGEGEAFASNPVFRGTGGTTLFWNPKRPPGLEDPCKGINMAWEALPRNSPLCRLTVQCFCDNIVQVERHTDWRQYHPGFLAAVAQDYAVRLGRVDCTYQVPNWDLKGQICKFHEHNGEGECPFAKRDKLARNSHISA